MKAIILERRGDYAALLCEDGTFEKRRVSGAVGETVELSAKVAAFPAKRRSRWMRGAVAAVLALALTGGTLGYMGGTANAYVSLDVDEDSAIELQINHFGRVIAVNALDENTKELAESLAGEVRHHRAEDALDITMERLHARGCFDAEGGAVIVGVATDDGRRASELKGFAERSMERAGGPPAYIIETSRAERAQAMGEHRSAGRFGFERDHGKGFPGGVQTDGPEWERAASVSQEPSDEEESSAPTSVPTMSAQPPREGEQPAPGGDRPPRDGRP